jgi:NAD(P)H dehydrogenase (quinone)
MKHLLVVAHPAEDSLTMTLARAYREELLARGQQCEWFDLYRAGFDPVLCADEIGPRTALRPVAADVARAQADVVAADAMAVIYPLWWLAMPAMMKGYVDRVLARGFAYEVRDGVAQGLMNGKKLVLITLSAGSMATMVDNGKWAALELLQETHMFRSAGFDLLEHLHIGAVVPGYAAAQAEASVSRVRACVRKYFPAA